MVQLIVFLLDIDFRKFLLKFCKVSKHDDQDRILKNAS